MGNGNAYFVDALHEHGIEYSAMRHEAGAVSAADAYHRISGRLGVATVTYGAGFTNTVTALQEAQMAATPMVLVAGDAPNSGSRPYDTDQSAIAAALSVQTFRVSSVHDAQRVVHEAVATALSTLQPVVLAIPHDISTSSAEWVPELPSAGATRPENGDSSSDTGLVPSVALDVASKVLAAAKRPLILAGRGARLSGAGPALGTLAAGLGALTCTTLLAQGLFPDMSADLGIAGGFGQELALQTMAQADVVLVAGARLNGFTLNMGQLIGLEATVIQIDILEGSRHPRADIFIHGDVGTVATMIEEALNGLGGVRAAQWRQSVGDVSTDAYQHRADVSEFGADGLLDPRALAKTIGELLPEDRVLLQDLGNFSEWMPTCARLSGPGRTAMLGSAFQSIGLGLAGVVGAAAAAPESTIVLATGDGGLLMALADMESVVRESTSSVIIVFNDAAYGAEIHQYGNYGLRVEPMLIPDVDFASLGASLGAQVATVRELSDLQALRDWNLRGGTGTLILDCKVSPEIVSPVLGEVAKGLERPAVTV